MNERIDGADRRILALLQDNSAATIQRIAAAIGLSASTVHERIRKLEARTPDGDASATMASPVTTPPATSTRATAGDRADRADPAPVILGYEARIDPVAVRLGLLGFVFVGLDEPVGAGDAGLHLAAIPEVQEVHHIAGEDCYLVKLRTQDTASLGRLLRERFASIPNIRSTRTTIVLNTIKETARLPIAADLATNPRATDTLATAPPPFGVDPIEMSATPHARQPARTGARRTTRTAEVRRTRTAHAKRRESEQSE